MAERGATSTGAGRGELEQQTARAREVVGQRLAAAAAPLLERFPPADYIAAFDAVELEQSYQFVPEAARAQCQRIEKDFGTEALELYHRWVLIELIASFRARLAVRRIPTSVVELIEAAFVRILRGVESAPADFHQFGNELFVKDFATCRLRMLPCGSEAVDVASGIPRSTLFKGGLAQFAKLGRLVASELGGFRPLYESHWDRRLARLFNEASYNECYLRIADLLELNPQVRGMFGASWWLDPALHEIAPEFDFLRRVPVENGAHIFRIGPDAGAVRDATTFSRKRRELYEAGKYNPERYLLVWPRGALLEWARRFRATAS
jgi:hypothetical protein